MKICIDIDDYHSFPKWDCSDVLLRFISKFPDIKFTIFITPLMRRIPLTDYPRAIDRIREMVLSGHVEIFPHGLTHKKIIKGEFGGIPKRAAKKRIIKSAVYLDKAAIPFKKGFKFPWNMYNEASLHVLEEIEYILFSNKLKKNFKGSQVIWENSNNKKKRYIQTENYKYGIPEIPDKDDLVYYHGHAQNFSFNGIRESRSNFLKELYELKRAFNCEFIFCSELIE